MKEYSITTDILYINFIRSKPKLSEKSKTQYRITLNKFCRATQTTLQEIIDNCKSQQNRVTEKIIKTTTTSPKCGGVNKFRLMGEDIENVLKDIPVIRLKKSEVIVND